jgi:hypothetical protein
VPLKVLNLLRQLFRQPLIVSVKKRNQVAFRSRDPRVARPRRSAVRLPNVLDAIGPVGEGFGQFSVILGSVIDDDDFERAKRLREHRLERGVD